MHAIFGPTLDELLHPDTIAPDVRARARAARTANILDPINLFNMNWKNPDTGKTNYFVMPQSITGVEAQIVVMVAKDFPTGSHKVGPAYSCTIEKYVNGELDPDKHTLVFPSTGNYGVGGAWVSGRAGFKGMVILPEGMSKERFQMIESFGAGIIKTYGSESNVKEIYDECNRIRREHPEDYRILNQFEEMGNYRFHYHVTGNTAVELEQELSATLGTSGISAFCSSMGSAGTIAAADRLKQVFPGCKAIGLEPTQCPTLFNNGYGSHEIQGIGDKHVTWIHHVTNMDGLACVDDMECLRILHVFSHPLGQAEMKKAYGLSDADTANLANSFGISGICNLIGAIKTAKHFGMGKKDAILIPATDNMARYHSTMADMEQHHPMSETAVHARVGGILRNQKTDWYMDGTPEARRRWHNLKYYTWVEQQGKTVAELNAQLDPEWWLAEQAKIPAVNKKIAAMRG